MGPGFDVEEAIARYLEQHEDWLNDHEQRQADREEMLKIVADWEQEHGPITPQEKAQARATLGL